VPSEIGVLSNEADPETIKGDNINVYWLSRNRGGVGGGGLYACAKGGCGSAPTKLYGGVGAGEDFLLDEQQGITYVGDLSSKAIDVCPTSGCNGMSSSLAKGPLRGFDLRSGYFFAIVGGQPHQFKTDGTLDLSLSGIAENAYDIAAPPGSGRVYWSSTPGFKVRTAMAGDPNSAADWVTTASPERIVADAAVVVWESFSQFGSVLYACPVGQLCASATTLSDYEQMDDAFGSFIVDGGTVYWVAYDPKLSSVVLRGCAASGCAKTPTTIASVPAAPQGDIGGLTADGKYFYFVLGSGGTHVYRVAR